MRVGPPIDPVPPGPRPRWSVMIPTYDCAGYLATALGSVLAQDLGPETMQIEVVDDASDDDPAAVAARLGGGRVGFFRQPQNQGVSTNLTTCIRRARGEIVHILHGDDAVRPGFYTALDAAFGAHPEIGAAFCRHVYVDATGRWQALGALERPESGVLADAAAHLATEQRIMTPAMCVRRGVYEQLGGFHESLRCAEDWEMWVRVAAAWPIWYETEPLALYRMHEASNTGRHVRSAGEIAYTAEVIDLVSRYLPPERAPAIAAAARSTYACSALTLAEQAFARDDFAMARAQFLGAFALSRSPRVVAGALGAVARGLAARLTRPRRSQSA